MRRFVSVCAVALALLLPSSALAAKKGSDGPPIGVGIDIGGGYWFLDTAQFDLHLRVEFSLGKVVALGLRPGLLLNVRPNVEVGLPVDAYIRFKVSRLYFDVLGGLAVLFGNPLPLRAHVAGGVGVFVVRGFSIGVEAGWLQDGAQILARFAFTF